MKIAIPIVSPAMDEALRDMDEAIKLADILELRVDLMNSPNLEKLLHHCNIPKIVTCRHEDEGGRFKGEEERISYLQEAIYLGAEYVDIELRHYQRLDRKKTKFIISYHDIEGTPNNLREAYYKIDEKNPDIIKIATKANHHIDSLKMSRTLC